MSQPDEENTQLNTGTELLFYSNKEETFCISRNNLNNLKCLFVAELVMQQNSLDLKIKFN